MHSHGPAQGRTARVLQFSLAATVAYVIVCLVAGLHAHSLSLLSEAGHNVSDAAALGLSLAAAWIGNQPANEAKTFGYQRAGVLAAFFNALALVAVSTWIAMEAVGRFFHPAHVATGPMMAVAAAGVVMNGVIALLLWRTGAEDVNLRSVFIHMLGDTLSTAAVIVAAALIRFTGQTWLDPTLSLAIAALILWSSVSIVRETLNILLEGAPQGMALEEIRSALIAVDGVQGVHDLHVWSIGSNMHALASHVLIDDIPPSESNAIMDRMKAMLRERFRILHTTMQFENCACPTEHGCVMALEVHEFAHDHGHEHHHHHGHAH